MILEPFKHLVLYCVDLAAAEYLSGRMSMEEAIDYGMELTNKYSETEEFTKIVEEYYNNFVDIKKFRFRNKGCV